MQTFPKYMKPATISAMITRDEITRERGKKKAIVYESRDRTLPGPCPFLALTIRLLNFLCFLVECVGCWDK